VGLRFPPLYSVRMKLCRKMRIANCGLPSLALQVGKGWAMNLRFPHVFSEDEMM
jgi:hypothetical protein